jgi:TonB family protein
VPGIRNLVATVVAVATALVGCTTARNAQTQPATADQPPRPIVGTQVLPIYPTISRTLGEQGTSQLQLGIGTDGRITDCRITKSAGERLDAAACAIVAHHWRYQPATHNGIPIASSDSTEIIWNLNGVSKKAIAQEASTTRPRFVGVWLLSNTRDPACFAALKIATVNDRQANLGSGATPESARLAVHDVSGPQGFSMSFYFQPAGENILGVKYEIPYRDKPALYYNSFELLDDNTMKAVLHGADGLIHCNYKKADARVQELMEQKPK